MFHNGGPSTVPWYTILHISISFEYFPPTATRAFRADSQDFNTAKMSSCTPFDCSFLSNRLAFTLSKAPDTSEQYTPILRFRPKSEIQVATRCARASLAPHSGIYANWLYPKALIRINRGTNSDARTSSAALLSCDVKWMPL